MFGVALAFVIALATVILVRHRIKQRRKVYDCSGFISHNAMFDYSLIRGTAGRQYDNLGHIQAVQGYWDDDAHLVGGPGGYWVNDPDGPQG